jgi:tRNA(Arg) A34 adenosine deaminase TadA
VARNEKRLTSNEKREASNEQQSYMSEAFSEAFSGFRNNQGGPFGAVIVKDGKIIGKGCNMVVSQNDPTAHAEMVAIRQASKNINSYDLSGSVIYSTCEPCPMCFSAVYWANIKEVIFSLSRYDAEQMGFKDNHIYNEISIDHDERNIRFIKVDHPAVKDLIEEWNLKTDKFQY